MSALFDRLRRGERSWMAESGLRSAGVLLLATSARLAFLAHALTTAAPHHQPTTGELAICAATVIALTGGLTLTIEGPGLFRLVSVPGRTSWH